MDGSTILSLALLGTVVAAVTEGLRRVAKDFQQAPWWVRLLPLFPLALGSVLAVAVPSLAIGNNIGERALFGVIAGAFSGSAYQIIARQVSAKVKSHET